MAGKLDDPDSLPVFAPDVSSLGGKERIRFQRRHTGMINCVTDPVMAPVWKKARKLFPGRADRGQVWLMEALHASFPYWLQCRQELTPAQAEQWKTKLRKALGEVSNLIDGTPDGFEAWLGNAACNSAHLVQESAGLTKDPHLPPSRVTMNPPLSWYLSEWIRALDGTALNRALIPSKRSLETEDRIYFARSLTAWRSIIGVRVKF